MSEAFKASLGAEIRKALDAEMQPVLALILRLTAQRDEARSAHARVCDALEARRRRVEALEEGLRARLNDPTRAVRELARALLATEVRDAARGAT